MKNFQQINDGIDNSEEDTIGLENIQEEANELDRYTKEVGEMEANDIESIDTQNINQEKTENIDEMIWMKTKF